jgi:predicted glycoside hydrolase/deacetylase ChbG (UPF0249 family)
MLGVCICGLGEIAFSQPEGTSMGESAGAEQGKMRLIIRLDDVGFCHATNMALIRILDEGVATAVSVIVNTPWVDEAAEILRDHPEISVGVHTALNSEWREFRWGPVLAFTEVPSLVDAFGKFYGSRRDLMAHKPKVEEVAKELRAQIELGLRKGLRVSYCDYHMGASVSTLEFQEALEKLALEYNIGISRYFGEMDTPNVYKALPEKKLETGIKIINDLTTPGLHMLVVHPGLNTPEMAAMTDLNVFGLKNMAQHRQAVTDMLCHPRFREAIEKKGIELIDYDELKAEGLHLMKRPFTADKYETVVRETLQESY